MSKQHETRKEAKRKPALTLKEKRAAKKAKKQDQSAHSIMPDAKAKS